MPFTSIGPTFDATEAAKLNAMLQELYDRGKTLIKTISRTDSISVDRNSETFKLVTLQAVPVGKWAFFGNCFLQSAAGVTIVTKHFDIGIHDGIDSAPADGSTNADHLPMPAGDSIVMLAGPRFFTFTEPTDVHLHVASNWTPSSGVVKACGTLWGFKITE